ncbi:MAG: class I SAM-dependent methyltransferase [Candidatus Zixiibacteriota bacterium]
MSSLEQNRIWSDRIISKIDTSFRHRWEIYDEIIECESKDAGIWLDLGAGDNEHIERFGHNSDTAIGMDLIFPGHHIENYVNADIKSLPIATQTVDLITLRYVVEHIDDIESAFSEMARILRPGGKIIVLTTNRRNPIIALASIIPFGIKQKLISSVFRVEHDDVMKTYHRLNTPERFKKGFKNLKLDEIHYISDLNYARKIVFLIYLAQHIITYPFRPMRSNIIAIYKKTDIPKGI